MIRPKSYVFGNAKLLSFLAASEDAQSEFGRNVGYQFCRAHPSIDFLPIRVSLSGPVYLEWSNERGRRRIECDATDDGIPPVEP